MVGPQHLPPRYLDAIHDGRQVRNLSDAKELQLSCRTDSFAQLVGLCCKVFYPVAHREHWNTFEAGKMEDLDPGPFLGRVIVWGLPVGIHGDGLDRRPTLTTDSSFFTGGDMPLPDFRCKFR